MEAETIFFDPDKHPNDTLKSFKIFCLRFELRYDAQFTDPPKTAMDSTIQRWVLQNTTEATPKPVPTVDQYDELKENWKLKDKVAKVLGMFSSQRLYADWEVAQDDQTSRRNADWIGFKETMEDFYKPTQNLTLTNYQFRSLVQQVNETFPSFCNRVEQEAKSCSFKCRHADCSAEATAIRDQIVIGTTNCKIREEALLRSWDLSTVRIEGMRLESATRGETEISGGAVNRIGKYSYSNIKRNTRRSENVSDSLSRKTENSTICFNCNEGFKGPAYKHNETCKARNNKCRLCSKLGHFPKYCRSYKEVKYSETEQKGVEENDVYNVNIFKVGVSNRTEFKTVLSKSGNHEFTVEVVVNGSITSVTADTGARVSVCGKHEAKRWNLLEKIMPTAVRIKPYNSPAVATEGMARCSVTFGSTSIPVEWYILDGRCEPILSGAAAVQLGIIHFTKAPPIYKPIHMINIELKKSDQERIQNVLARRPENFSTVLGKHKDYQVKFHTDPNVKPVVTPARPTPYHLAGRISKVLDEMISDDVIEEHPVGDPTPWISNAVIVPKPNGSLRVTLDARNINKAIQSSNLPIPRQEDIKAKLGGAEVFSKLDFKSAFWQLELHPDSRSLTAFSMNNKLYRYKRLTMGVKSAQGELNAALLPLFRHIPDAHLIHDDLIVASKDITQHIIALDEVLTAVQQAGLTLNEEKCWFGMKEIKFWGMIINSKGVQPDPEKVEALDGLQPPKTKDELLSFICMMQSNAEFIPSFAKKASVLRELTKEKVRFKWEEKHQKCFEQLLSAFRKDVLLRYFDVSKQIYLFTDAHITGLGAILAQGSSLETAKPVAIASRTTTVAEKKYPQIDLEGLGVDYALYRFRNYLIGAPNTITVVTDHMPLCSVFNGSRTGSIRTERFKQRNQDIRFKVVYQRGKNNQSDFISRRAAPISERSNEEQHNSQSINNLLYMLHTTPIMDRIGLKTIAEETANDVVLMKLQKIVKSGKTWIPKNSEESLQRFRAILPEITITGNGILLKGDRIILPDKLQSVAIELAHQGSHPGQSAMERRLRYHFFFHHMNIEVEKFLRNCTECSIFTDKKCKEPIKSHKVPENCWEKVSVDLFGPMPSRNHIMVVQDMSSRFPAAKLVSSTSANKVLPALAEIYDAYGNPDTQLSDNGPPFNSASMEKFAEERNIKLEKIPPLHPSANPVETFMRPLGKTMKIANHKRNDEKGALQSLLRNYRDTPHPATGVPPAAMMFRDSMTGVFPRKVINEDNVQEAKRLDEYQKSQRETDVNSSKYKKHDVISLGDQVLVRNYTKTRKFHPIFSPEQYIVTNIADYGRKLQIERVSDGKTLVRHPDDLKTFTMPNHPPVVKNISTPDQWKILSEASNQDDDFNWWYNNIQPEEDEHAPEEVVGGEDGATYNLPDVGNQPAVEVRRSNRVRRSPDRMGAEVYDAAHPLQGEDLVIAPWWPGYPRNE